MRFFIKYFRPYAGVHRAPEPVAAPAPQYGLPRRDVGEETVTLVDINAHAAAAKTVWRVR